MNVDATGIVFIKQEEASGKPVLQAYKNKGDVWSIAYGNTFYEDGTPIRQGDKITVQRAEQLFANILNQFGNQVAARLKTNVTQNQFNALVSYAYNRGVPTFARTTLLGLVNQNPNNPQIVQQFAIEWGTNQTYKTALIARRKREATLYSTGSNSTDNMLATVLIIGSISFLTYQVTNS